jgi:hypothetical protein
VTGRHDVGTTSVGVGVSRPRLSVKTPQQCSGSTAERGIMIAAVNALSSCASQLHLASCDNSSIRDRFGGAVMTAVDLQM